MNTLLKLPEGLFEDLIEHLLPRRQYAREEAAFLFVSTSRSSERVVFDVLESVNLRASDFAQQEGDYLELADDSRARLIKRAHDLGASLVEIHSHPGSSTAGFSYADRLGLSETVPHMWWRLPRRPYLALVVTTGGFDALVWLDDPRVPRQLDGLLAGSRLLRPTNKSLAGWT